MKRRGNSLGVRWRESADFRTKAGTLGGFAATVAFALYNGVLGVSRSSLWHGSICVYYLLLSALRGGLLAAKRRDAGLAEDDRGRHRWRMFWATAAATLLMTAALAVPAALMVLDRRPVRMGLIPAIASAAYTTYKISAAAVKLRRREGDLFARELRVLRFVDAMVSILVLQNTLIRAVDGSVSQEMFYLTAISSAGLLLVIFAALLVWTVRGSREVRQGCSDQHCFT